MKKAGNNLTRRKTRSVVDLKNASKKVVWTPPLICPYLPPMAAAIFFVFSLSAIGLPEDCPKRSFNLALS